MHDRLFHHMTSCKICRSSHRNCIVYIFLDCLPVPFLYAKQSARGRLRELQADLSRQGKGLVFLCAVSLITKPDMVQNGSCILLFQSSPKQRSWNFFRVFCQISSHAYPTTALEERYGGELECLHNSSDVSSQCLLIRFSRPVYCLHAQSKANRNSCFKRGCFEPQLGYRIIQVNSLVVWTSGV